MSTHPVQTPLYRYQMASLFLSLFRRVRLSSSTVPYSCLPVTADFLLLARILRSQFLDLKSMRSLSSLSTPHLSLRLVEPPPSLYAFFNFLLFFYLDILN